MRMRKGRFTGRKLVDYFSDPHTDYVDARKIINGLDKANLIAGYARKFQALLQASLIQPLKSF
jgi:putative chitinase